MAVSDLSNVSKALKRDYKDPIRDQLNSSSVMYYRMEKNTEDVSGVDLTAVLSVMRERNQGIGSRAESGTLPTAQRRKYSEATVAMAYTYGKIRLTGQTISASRNDKTRFAKILDDEIQGMVEGMRIEMNVQLHGRGTGAIGRIGSGTTAVADGTAFAVVNAAQLEEGMVIDTYTTNASSGGSAGFDSKQIESVDYVNNKIVMVDDLSGAANEANDYIYREDSRGNTMMGLEGIIDGTDSAGTRLITTFQGLSRATNYWWNANVIDNGAVNRDLTIVLVQRAFETGEVIGDGKTSVILSHYDLRRTYLDLLSNDRRYAGFGKLDGGFTALEYTGGGEPVPWIVDRHCPKNRAYFIDESHLAMYIAAEFNWMDLDGAVLRKVADKDEYDADMYTYANFGTDKSNVHTVLRDVT